MHLLETLRTKKDNIWRSDRQDSIVGRGEESVDLLNCGGIGSGGSGGDTNIYGGTSSGNGIFVGNSVPGIDEGSKDGSFEVSRLENSTDSIQFPWEESGIIYRLFF